MVVPLYQKVGGIRREKEQNEAGKGLKTHHPQHSAPDAAQRDADELRAGRRAEATPRPAVIEASTPR